MEFRRSSDYFCLCRCWNSVVRPINGSDRMIRANIGSPVTHVPRSSGRFAPRFPECGIPCVRNNLTTRSPAFEKADTDHSGSFKTYRRSRGRIKQLEGFFERLD